MASSSIFDNPPKALLTDVFGTVVNWRLTVTTTLSTRASSTLNSPSASLPSTLRATASATDWGAFAQKWRESYYRFCHTHDPAKQGPSGYKTIDLHHRESLEQILAQFDLSGLWSTQEMNELAMVWHFLTPWPDSSHGLALLNQRFITTTLSNGNVSLLEDLAKTGNLPYKEILSSEMFKAYKPNPLVYNGAAGRLGLKTSECALVAAHLGDLEAARNCGYRTIYIDRVKEEAWSLERKEKAREWVDVWVDGTAQSGQDGFVAVAKAFGIMDESENKRIEEQARQGTYQEDGAIMGTEKEGKL